jgi:hypothetical protein
MKALLLLAAFLAIPAWAAGPDFIATPEGVVISDVERRISRQAEFSWTIDPFVKVPGNLTVPAEDDDYVLQATLLEGRQPAAILNDRLVRVGDVVSGRSVRRIGRDFVLLERGGSVIEVGLYENGNQQELRPSEPSNEPEIRIEEIVP